MSAPFPSTGGNGAGVWACHFRSHSHGAREEQDSDGDCRYDSWNYYKAGRLQRQARDSEGRGRAHILYVFDRNGQVVIQETASPRHPRPDTKTFYDANGQVERQCRDSDRNGVFDTELAFSGGQATSAVIDSQRTGAADRREVYLGGVLVRVEADTNGDRRPDIVQHYEGKTVVRQDEDSDYDGRIDVRFENGAPVELQAAPKMPAKIPALDCGRFNGFWD